MAVALILVVFGLLVWAARRISVRSPTEKAESESGFWDRQI